MRKRYLIPALLLTAGMLLLPGCSSEKEVFIEGTPVSGAAESSASDAEAGSASGESVLPEEEAAVSDQEAEAEEASGEEAVPKVSPAAKRDRAILAVSFGTSYNITRNITIGGIENALREAFPDYEVRRAFTAASVIETLAGRDGILIDDVETAVERCAEDGIRELVILPTHLTGGSDYEFIREIAGDHEADFDSLSVAEPLLADEDDLAAVAEAITAKTADYADGSTAVVFVGEGSGSRANAVYGELQEALSFLGYSDYYIGTLTAEPSLEDVMKACGGKGYTRVVLEDLMVVAGDHAYTEMAGDAEDSWETAFRNEGYEVTCIMDGLGQIYDIQKIYVRHAAEAGGMEIPSWAE